MSFQFNVNSHFVFETFEHDEASFYIGKNRKRSTVAPAYSKLGLQIKNCA